MQNKMIRGIPDKSC